MGEEKNLTNFLKNLIKKGIKSSASDNVNITAISKHSLSDDIDIEDINIFDIKESMEKKIMRTKESINNQTKIEDNNNLNIGRIANKMLVIKKDAEFLCKRVNKLNQAILKVKKSSINQEQLANLGVIINNDQLYDHEVLEVGFKYKHEIDNPCGGTVQGEALLKMVVLVVSIQYSWILYDKVNGKTVYDEVEGSTTAYSVLDIVPFDDKTTIPKKVNAEFKPGALLKLDMTNDDNVDFYIFTIDGVVDIVEEY